MMELEYVYGDLSEILGQMAELGCRSSQPCPTVCPTCLQGKRGACLSWDYENNLNWKHERPLSQATR